MKLFSIIFVLLTFFLATTLPVTGHAKLVKPSERLQAQHNSTDLQTQKDILKALESLEKLQKETNSHLSTIASESKKQNLLWQKMLAASKQSSQQ